MLKTTNRSYLDHYIAMVIIALMAVGTVFVCSASANLTVSNDLHRVVFFPAAIATMLIASLFPYQWFKLPAKGFVKSFTPWLYAVSIILLSIVLFTNLGERVNNATRWISIQLGSFDLRFQPSEIAKWATVFLLSGYMCKYSDRVQNFFKGFVPACCLAGVVFLLIVTQDLGTAAYIMLLSGLIMLLGGARVWHFLTPMPFVIPAFVYVIMKSPNRLKRITAFLNPENADNAAVYQAAQSKIAISTGGLCGKGLGRGICKWGHLPEDTTDFIFAVISEEMGLLGCLVVIALFTILAVLGFMVIRKCKDPFGKLMAAGITAAICIQAALNIGVVTVVLPTKGIPLPFISAGGTSLLVTAASVGVLINIARQSCKMEANQL